MPSLTPINKSEEVTWIAMREGLINGGLTLIPTYGALLLALRNPAFRQYTNWQSRTALVIMPGLFMFGYSAESKLNHRMQQMALETEQNRGVARWAEEQISSSSPAAATGNNKLNGISTEERLTELYKQSVENSGVRIVPSLGMHHRVANYWQENPFKVLALLGVPTVGYIFYGRSGQAHLQTQMKVMHTRVMGQFSVIALLLGLMGFKEYMDRNGKFITEDEANDRVAEMHQVREEIKERLRQEKQVQLAMEQERARAHAADVAAGQTHDKKAKKKKHNNNNNNNKANKNTAAAASSSSDVTA